MGFDALLGNDRLKQNLTRSLSKGHVSHFYLCLLYTSPSPRDTR